MITRVALILLFTIIFIFPSFSDDSCSDVNNSTWFTSTDHIRNQGDIGWCYAFTAADMLSIQTNQILSSRDIANSFNNNIAYTIYQRLTGKEEYQLEGGYIKAAIKAALKKGVCTEEALPSPKNGKIQAKMENIYLLKSSLDREIKQEASFEAINYLNDPSVFPSALRSFFPKLTLSDFTDLMTHFNTKNFYEELINKNCANDRISLNHDLDFTYDIKLSSFQNEIFRQKIDRYLNQGKIVGIGYFASVLTNPTGRLSGRHASSIIARRYNQQYGRCEYMVRNSWGPDCNKYAKGVLCKKGHLWVDQTQLLRSITGIVVIK